MFFPWPICNFEGQINQRWNGVKSIPTTQPYVFFNILKFHRDFDTDSQGNGEGSTFSEALNE